MLPNRIFFTGIPGSSWSKVSEIIEQLDGINTSDHSDTRLFIHSNGKGRHAGAYFGNGMEFSLDLSEENINSPWDTLSGTKIVKGHEWSTCIPEILIQYPNDWIFLIYTPVNISIRRWLNSGGFNIKYPNYSFYKNEETMNKMATHQTELMLQFSKQHLATWNHFTPDWLSTTFNQPLSQNIHKMFDDVHNASDILVTVIKGKN
jgi:hypothetical protein